MKGMQIFLHSVRQVTGNFEGALRVSLVPYAIQFAFAYLVAGPALMSGAAGPDQFGQFGAGTVLVPLLVLLVVLLTSIWSAVAWHRFVLKGESPSGWIPDFNGSRIWAYFLRSLGIVLLIMIASFPLGMLAGMIAMPFFSDTGPNLTAMALIGLITYLPMAVISYRLSTALPSTALDTAEAFSAGWEATKGESAAILGLSVITVAGYLAVSALAFWLFGGIFILSLIWDLAFGWFAIMVGLSILTTLYGHYIEKRPMV